MATTVMFRFQQFDGFNIEMLCLILTVRSTWALHFFESSRGRICLFCLSFKKNSKTLISQYLNPNFSRHTMLSKHMGLQIVFSP